jgi:hypothetical protein
VSGSPGSDRRRRWRDPRGFALRFYTTECNYDLVGNNTPAFFIRDPMRFGHFIRSQKRRPDNGLRDNDIQWDFWSLSPESAHQVTWLMGDRGVPKTLRQTNGYGSHTFLWINGEAEADHLAGADGDYHRRDLYQAIKRGDHPSWTLKVQVMPFDHAPDYRFNPFDLTKVWPHGDYPLFQVGRLTLDRNPENFFAEIEQSAFEPSNLVPGIGPSPDKRLTRPVRRQRLRSRRRRCQRAGAAACLRALAQRRRRDRQTDRGSGSRGGVIRDRCRRRPSRWASDDKRRGSRALTSLPAREGRSRHDVGMSTAASVVGLSSSITIRVALPARSTAVSRIRVDVTCATRGGDHVDQVSSTISTPMLLAASRAAAVERAARVEGVDGHVPRRWHDGEADRVAGRDHA